MPQTSLCIAWRSIRQSVDPRGRVRSSRAERVWRDGRAVRLCAERRSARRARSSRAKRRLATSRDGAAVSPLRPPARPRRPGRSGAGPSRNRRGLRRARVWRHRAGLCAWALTSSNGRGSEAAAGRSARPSESFGRSVTTTSSPRARPRVRSLYGSHARHVIGTYLWSAIRHISNTWTVGIGNTRTASKECRRCSDSGRSLTYR